MPDRDSISDSISLNVDSIRASSLTEGIVIASPSRNTPVFVKDENIGMSIVTGVLLLLFCVVALRFKNNARYITAMFSELTEVRERHNVFDDTVKETSFLVLLNILWCCCAGVMLYTAICWFNPPDITASFAIPVNSPLCMAVCSGVALGYSLLLYLAYFTVGNVFSDRAHAAMWVRGFAACQGLTSILLLPISLLAICMPGWTQELLWLGGGIFLLGKILFISKGFRIFFTQISSWVLFLYYLCSLEIIPLILSYLAAMFLCIGMH